MSSTKQNKFTCLNKNQVKVNIKKKATKYGLRDYLAREDTDQPLCLYSLVRAINICFMKRRICRSLVLKVHIRLPKCKGCFEPLLGVHVIKHRPSYAIAYICMWLAEVQNLVNLKQRCVTMKDLDYPEHQHSLVTIFAFGQSGIICATYGQHKL